VTDENGVRLAKRHDALSIRALRLEGKTASEVLARRRIAREHAADGGLEETESFFEPLDLGDERRVAIEAALARLPADQRDVLVLKIWGERTFEHIGVMLALSPLTAASRYRSALKALRRELSSVEYHE